MSAEEPGMRMQATDLKPCPHCGEADHLYLIYADTPFSPTGINCIGCGADFTPYNAKSTAEIIAAWNRRPTGAPS